MGAKVLQTRSVEYAKAKGVTLRVKSSFLPAGESAGTEVVPEAEIAEKRVVSGVAYVRDQARCRSMAARGPKRPKRCSPHWARRRWMWT
jgi:aspartate kinase